MLQLYFWVNLCLSSRNSKDRGLPHRPVGVHFVPACLPARTCVRACIHRNQRERWQFQPRVPRLGARAVGADRAASDRYAGPRTRRRQRGSVRAPPSPSANRAEPYARLRLAAGPALPLARGAALRRLAFARVLVAAPARARLSAALSRRRLQRGRRRGSCCRCAEPTSRRRSRWLHRSENRAWRRGDGGSSCRRCSRYCSWCWSCWRQAA